MGRDGESGGRCRRLLTLIILSDRICEAVEGGNGVRAMHPRLLNAVPSVTDSGGLAWHGTSHGSATTVCRYGVVQMLMRCEQPVVYWHNVDRKLEVMATSILQNLCWVPFDSTSEVNEATSTNGARLLCQDIAL